MYVGKKDVLALSTLSPKISLRPPSYSCESLYTKKPMTKKPKKVPININQLYSINVSNPRKVTPINI